MKDLGKSLFYLFLIIVIIGITIYCLDNYSHKSDSSVANSNNVENNSTNINTNTSSNNTKNTNLNNTTNTENKINDNKNEKEEEENKKEEIKNETEVVSVTGEQKAVELAKKEFGITEGVYYNCEKTQSNNVYIVSVRDEETTRALAWYTVDVVEETVK